MRNKVMVVRLRHWRVLSFSMFALLLGSARAAADCVKPHWQDPASFMGQSRESRDAYSFAFVNRTHEFIVCQRGTLEKRALGLAPPEVRQLILQDREIEDRALADADRIFRCMSIAGREPDAAIVRQKCETYVEWSLHDMRRKESPGYDALNSAQRIEHGGILSFRTVDLGRPGQCNHAECPNVLGVEVTNQTPVILKCDVALTISNPDDGVQRGQQRITLYPGDAFPAARVASSRKPEAIEPEVSCSAVKPSASDLSVPASCALNWLPRFLEFPRRFGRSWTSGTALVEFTAGQRHGNLEAIRLVQADSSHLGEAALEHIGKLSASTNCPGQLYRMRVEYRPFTCFYCYFEQGTVAITRDDRLLPD
jgi:hypothetical protein